MPGHVHRRSKSARGKIAERCARQKGEQRAFISGFCSAARRIAPSVFSLNFYSESLSPAFSIKVLVTEVFAGEQYIYTVGKIQIEDTARMQFFYTESKQRGKRRLKGKE